ncbi:MAG TPA: hypothetical protein VFC63_27135 [Blastocatellia bacterium]|nr:hypothetical protein [Blastocatellia bacterium]
MAKRSTAKAVRLTCPKCLAAFTVVAFISRELDKNEYYQKRAAEHDCAAHAKMMAQAQGDGTKNPLKASKAAAKGK